MKTIAVAAMPTISPRSVPGVDEHLQVVVGLASQIQASDNTAPRLKDESNHVGNNIVASGGIGLEWMAGFALERVAGFRLESVAGFIGMCTPFVTRCAAYANG
jgi:hypothetical protein